MRGKIVVSSLFIFPIFFFSSISHLYACKSYEFECVDDGRCIHEKWVCDGEEDCFDSSDEAQNCTRIVTRASPKFVPPKNAKENKFSEPLIQKDTVKECKLSEFECKNRQCVPLSSRCNKVYDCVDHSDEIGCRSNNYENVFNRTRDHNLTSEEIPGSSDFLESIVTSLEGLKNGEAVPVEQLNQFPQGLNQYYLSRAYEYYFSTVKPLNETYNDPVCMPNATSEDMEFYRVKVFGFPAFKNNANTRQEIDTSPYAKNYTIYFNATSDVTIINGYFKVNDQRYYFVYHTYDNVYTTEVDVIRTNDVLLKRKSTAESFDVRKSVFVHTCDSTEEDYDDVNPKVYPTFQKVLSEVYMPRLSFFVEGVLRPVYPGADVSFSEAYRTKLREALLSSAREYLLLIDHVTHEFPPQKLTRETPIPGFTAVYTYTATIDGFLNYSTYEFNSSQSEANGTTLLMYDSVTLHYPEKVCNMNVVVKDHKNASYDETFQIKSIEIMIAYKASLASFPIHVYRNLEKWRFVQTGFFSQIEFYKLNPFYNFVAGHAQVELGKLLGTGFVP